MSTPSPAPHHRSFDIASWLPSPRALLWVLLAFVAGLLLFALVLSRGRDDFYRAGPAPPTAAGPDYAPLPTPLPAGRQDASGLQKPPAADSDDERPQLVETRPPPPPAPPAAPAPPRPAPAPTAASSQPQPIAGQTPAPRYPMQALRRGERGTVTVRAEIGADGVPASVSVARGSGSHSLDRAAVDAVRRWRFRPAMRGGQPTTAVVEIPVEFKP